MCRRCVTVGAAKRKKNRSMCEARLFMLSLAKVSPQNFASLSVVNSTVAQLGTGGISNKLPHMTPTELS